eukprot:scaffold5000_cov76-Cyclotella_meneghiniana.AAC.5
MSSEEVQDEMENSFLAGRGRNYIGNGISDRPPETASSWVDMHNIAVEMHTTAVAVASSNRDYNLIDFRRLDVAALFGCHLEETASSWVDMHNIAVEMHTTAVARD